jgi:hypothetical protein
MAVDMADRSQVAKTSPKLVVESHELKLSSLKKNVESCFGERQAQLETTVDPADMRGLVTT